MLRSFLERVQPLVKVEEPSLTLCSRCGEPSSSPVCQFCRVKSRVEELRAGASPHLESSRRVAHEQPLHHQIPPENAY
jgi:predicted amidophosphoribosyltransferase